jgi:hypothetical protein
MRQTQSGAFSGKVESGFPPENATNADQSILRKRSFLFSVSVKALWPRLDLFKSATASKGARGLDVWRRGKAPSRPPLGCVAVALIWSRVVRARARKLAALGVARVESSFRAMRERARARAQVLARWLSDRPVAR